MSKKFGLTGLVGVLAVLLLVQGCAKKTTSKTGEGVSTAVPQAGRGMKVREEAGLKDIGFDFDQSAIRPDAKNILKQNAEWMVKNPGANVLVEGHCDDRGTTEYNLALGERRALSVKAYLVTLGIKADRIYTISYGEELPLDAAHSEEAWAKNRRAHTVVTTK
ncbi:MAG: peptidoglycan-associated lipoprotein Pal [Nitrospinae bacterium]|nr:peptidoglycan-associated lipoprotein Pal [Nitrospinota bacterium]